jgi:hypothetical protein
VVGEIGQGFCHLLHGLNAERLYIAGEGWAWEVALRLRLLGLTGSWSGAARVDG